MQHINFLYMLSNPEKFNGPSLLWIVLFRYQKCKVGTNVYNGTKVTYQYYILFVGVHISSPTKNNPRK
jgi:hypothetical protein